MASRTENEPPLIIRFRNSLACVPCRTRHVKCDGNKPACARCGIDGKTCYFMKSRRGMRNKTPSASIQGIQPAIDTSNPAERPLLKSSPRTGTVASSLVLTPTSMTRPPSPASLMVNSAYQTPRLQIGSPKISNLAENELEKHLNLYYTFFHNAHPWALPQRCLNQLIQSGSGKIQDLLMVMEFIGSTYTSKGQSAFLRQKALDTMSAPTLSKTPFSVQALLILAVGVHCCSDFTLARDTLDRAISIALEIGMQFQCFAVTNGDGDPVLAESWRRTWWGLFVTDGSIEAIRRTFNFKTWHVHADVDLPCEEVDYRNECIPLPQTLAEYDERDLAEHEVSYSSFTYLIDLVRILGSMMTAAVNAEEITDGMVDDVDGILVNWKFHLPDDKKNILRENGEIDEMLFQAHIHFNVIQVHLHRVRSRLVHSPVENTAKCAPLPPPWDVPHSKRESYWLSTKKTLDAAERAINIFTLPGQCIKHTPMVVCAVVLSILAELSACSYVLHGDQYEAARNRIRLGIGTLKEYGKVWPVGHQSLVEVKSIAREVFAMAESRKNLEAESNLGTFGSSDSLDIQSYFEEFGALDYLSMLDIPI